ncbi:YgaP family membrane protein [Nocardioides pakistanensis]
MALVSFLASGAGRVLRAVVGLALIVLGVWLGGAGWVLAGVGLVALAAGAFGFCLLAPVVGRGLREGGASYEDARPTR